MTLTKTQRKRLAREARGLVDDILNGVAPKFGYLEFWHNGPACALGHFVARGGARNEYEALDIYSELPVDERIIVMHGNDSALNDNRHDAVVFPLLALADAIEAAP